MILAIDRRPVRGFADLLSYLVHHTRAGQIVKLTVLREGKQLEFHVTLTARPIPAAWALHAPYSAVECGLNLIASDCSLPRWVR